MNFSVLSPKYSLDLEVQNGVVFFFFLNQVNFRQDQVFIL